MDHPLPSTPANTLPTPTRYTHANADNHVIPGAVEGPIIQEPSLENSQSIQSPEEGVPRHPFSVRTAEYNSVRRSILVACWHCVAPPTPKLGPSPYYFICWNLDKAGLFTIAIARSPCRKQQVTASTHSESPVCHSTRTYSFDCGPAVSSHFPQGGGELAGLDAVQVPRTS